MRWRKVGELLGGRYRLKQSLAHDESTGTYYNAYDERLRRPVTVKCLHDTRNERTLRRYEREARILGALAHETLLQVYDVVLDEDDPYLVMEGLDAEPLSSFLKTPMDVDEACDIAESLAEALVLAHKRGFVHRRMLPDFVLMNKKGGAKLIGFGRASLGGGHSSSTSDIQAGPSPFTSPELFLRDDRDPRTDLYGVGSILYFLLTAHPPVAMEGYGVADAIRALMQAPRTPLREYRPELSTQLEAFLTRCLALDVNDRPESAGDLLRELQEARNPKPSVERSEAPMRPGEKLADRYIAESVIGRGSHGTVILARDSELQRDVAIKFIQGGTAELLLEARAMARVTHPNVVQVYDVGTRPPHAYLVMENVPGHTLEDRIGGGPIILDEAIAIVDQAARGLEAIHSAGLVHGDIKPSNILIGPAHQVRLADFGLVRTSATWADGASMGGTPGYYAPERVTETIREATAHSIDIYSLGILTYELLTGELPYQGGTPLEVLALHRAAPLPVLPASLGLSAFDDVISRALAKSPDARFETTKAFRRALLDAHTKRAQVPRSAEVLLVQSVDRSRGETRQSIMQQVEGATVHTATGGVAALASIRERRPDLVVMDMQLSDMNGIEFAGTLRANHDVPPPIVVFSAVGSASDWQVLSALGVEAFLLEPVDPELLALTVRRVLAREGVSAPTVSFEGPRV
ncbi:MAG: serine/threonine protein kinase [Polyangiales bacterium]|jgi:serine/threonine protein kinase